MNSKYVSCSGLTGLPFERYDYKLSAESCLFEVSLLDKEGNQKKISSAFYGEFDRKGDNFIFSDKEIFDGEIICKISNNGETVKFRIDIENNTDLIIESVNYPILEFPCKMKRNGGNDVVFWPSMEGALIEKADNSYFKSVDVTGGGGYTGLTPGASAMQYMAFFSDDDAVYYGAHDDTCCLKDFEYIFTSHDTVLFTCNNFPGGVHDYKMPYDFIVRHFFGDWQDAAEIYRNWVFSSEMSLPQKLSERNDLPDWLNDSPVTVLYPIRGTSDKCKDEEMAPNCYYPYTNILPIIDDLAKKTDSKMLPVLMHWEGSAPWSTPYIWPPYGDNHNFEIMVKELHNKGHLVGLYASGLGFTMQSVTDSSYINRDAFEKDEWKKSVCCTSNQNLRKTEALAFVRDGYEICPACEQTQRTIIDEALKLADADIDYFQAFDQNLGGIPGFCWSNNHGHPNAPGAWITESMIEIFRKMKDGITEKGKEMLFGCELAATEPMIKWLPFNDLRWFTVFRQGIPVPAYSYVYHEYINNYMGNQNGLEGMIDFSKCPDNLLYRTVYSFLAGDTLSVILGKDGMLNWGWNAPFDNNLPDGNIVLSFIKEANKWRRSFTKKYICYGKVVKGSKICCERSTAVVTVDGYEIAENNIMSRKYEASDGTKAEFFVNRTTTLQTFHIKEYNIGQKIYLNPETVIPFTDEIKLEPAQIVCIIDEKGCV